MLSNKDITDKIRTSFLAMAQNNNNKFHPKDVQKITDNDWSIERFVLVSKTEDAALTALVNAMEWRKAFGVNDFSDDYFPEEIYKIGFFNFSLKDKEDRPILWYKFSSYHLSALTPLFKQYAVYCYEKLDRQTSNQGWTLMFDVTGAGLSNIDLEISNFLINVLQNYYPRGLKNLVIIDMPMILSAVSKVIIAFMNEEFKSVLKFVSSKDQLTQYMNKQYIPVHLGGNYDKDMIVIPPEVKPLDQLTHTKLTSDQIKKIRSTFKLKLK